LVAGNRDKKRKISISTASQNDYVLCAQILQKIYLQKQKSKPKVPKKKQKLSFLINFTTQNWEQGLKRSSEKGRKNVKRN